MLAFRDCIPEPNTTATVDALSNRPMMQLNYRTFGSSESLIFNQTINVSGALPLPFLPAHEVAGVRWYELQNAGAGWTIRQQGTYAPQPLNATAEDQLLHYWMGSAAEDAMGNIALGYSIDNDDDNNPVYPSIRYTGRRFDDPLNLLPQAEQVILNGTTSLGGNGSFGNRWGDYSQMTVDPVDDCTFWYAQMVAGGATQIASFGFDTCAADLAITKTGSPDPVTVGSNLIYTIEVTNNGPVTAQSVTVTDDLPAETTFVSCSSTGGGVCGGLGNNRTVTFATLTSGQSETITLVANVNCSVAAGTAISNTATVSSFTPDPDTSNNSATATTAASNPPPTITNATADPSLLWPPNHRMVNVTVSYDVTDNCPLPPNSCTLSVTSNEPVLGHGSGHTSPDWIVVDDHHVLLRAEREGGGSGRIYTITITCTDSGGNSSEEQVEVTVSHDQGRR